MPFSVIILKLIQSTSKLAYKVYIKKNKEKRYILTFLFTRGSFKIKIQHVIQIFKRQGESNKPLREFKRDRKSFLLCTR